MKAIQLFQIGMLLATTLLTVGCANDDTAMRDEQQNSGKIPEGITIFSSETTPNTRTTLASHTKGNSADVLWEATDHVWVKDDGGIFQQSSSTTIPNPSNPTKAVFGLAGSFTGTSYTVVYTGKNSTSATEVEIKATQTQAVANSFTHLGESGDCGIATATKKSTGEYRFTLEHKAAYLCFYPRIENEHLYSNVKLNYWCPIKLFCVHIFLIQNNKKTG